MAYRQQKKGSRLHPFPTPLHGWRRQGQQQGWSANDPEQSSRTGEGVYRSADERFFPRRLIFAFRGTHLPFESGLQDLQEV